jgi:hypothetical protein
MLGVKRFVLRDISTRTTCLVIRDLWVRADCIARYDIDKKL